MGVVMEYSVADRWPHPSTSDTLESMDESDGLNPGQ